MASKAKATTALDAPVKRKTWSQSVRKDELTKDITVEELDNGGYLVVICKYGEDKKGNYKSITRKFYSETNPLDDEINDPFEQIVIQLRGLNK